MKTEVEVSGCNAKQRGPNTVVFMVLFAVNRYTLTLTLQPNHAITVTLILNTRVIQKVLPPLHNFVNIYGCCIRLITFVAQSLSDIHGKYNLIPFLLLSCHDDISTKIFGQRKQENATIRNQMIVHFPWFTINKLMRQEV